MTEIPLFPWWATLILALWAAIGPLAGIVIGHTLVRSWERRRWLADNQKEEYRKVLGGLSRLNMALSDHHVLGIDNANEVKLAMEDATQALNTCLFTAGFFAESGVASDVLVALGKLNHGGGFNEYHTEYWKAVNVILAAAKKSKL
jgi:hypothetical protein